MRLPPAHSSKRQDGVQVDRQVPPQEAEEVPGQQERLPEREQEGEGGERVQQEEQGQAAQQDALPHTQGHAAGEEQEEEEAEDAEEEEEPEVVELKKIGCNCVNV